MSKVINEWTFSQFCDAFGESLSSYDYMKVYPDFHEAIGKYDMKVIVKSILKREKNIQKCFYLFIDTVLIYTTYIQPLFGIILEISEILMNNGATYYGMNFNTYKEKLTTFTFVEQKISFIDDVTVYNYEDTDD